MSTQTQMDRMVAMLDECLNDREHPTNTPNVVQAARDFIVNQGKCAAFIAPIEHAGMQAYVDLVYDHAAVKAGLAPHHREWVTDAHVSAVLTAIHRIAQARMPTVKLGPNAAEELLAFDVHSEGEVNDAICKGYKIERRAFTTGLWSESLHAPMFGWKDFFERGGNARAVKA